MRYKEGQRGVTITIHAGKTSIKSRETRVNRMNRKNEQQAEKLHGLLRYLNKSICPDGVKPEDTTNDKCFDTGREYLISESINDEPWVELKCFRPDVYVGGGCNVITNFNDMLINYIFPRSQLNHWEKYDQAVKGLLGRFFVKKIDNTIKAKRN